MPAWVKQVVDQRLQAANITSLSGIRMSDRLLTLLLVVFSDKDVVGDSIPSVMNADE